MESKSARQIMPRSCFRDSELVDPSRREKDTARDTFMRLGLEGDDALAKFSM